MTINGAGGGPSDGVIDLAEALGQVLDRDPSNRQALDRLITLAQQNRYQADVNRVTIHCLTAGIPVVRIEPSPEAVDELTRDDRDGVPPESFFIHAVFPERPEPLVRSILTRPAFPLIVPLLRALCTPEDRLVIDRILAKRSFQDSLSHSELMGWAATQPAYPEVLATLAGTTFRFWDAVHEALPDLARDRALQLIMDDVYTRVAQDMDCGDFLTSHSDPDPEGTSGSVNMQEYLSCHDAADELRHRGELPAQKVAENLKVLLDSRARHPNNDALLAAEVWGIAGAVGQWVVGPEEKQALVQRLFDLRRDHAKSWVEHMDEHVSYALRMAASGCETLDAKRATVARLCALSEEHPSNDAIAREVAEALKDLVTGYFEVSQQRDPALDDIYEAIDQLRELQERCPEDPEIRETLRDMVFLLIRQPNFPTANIPARIDQTRQLYVRPLPYDFLYDHTPLTTALVYAATRLNPTIAEAYLRDASGLLDEDLASTMGEWPTPRDLLVWGFASHEDLSLLANAYDRSVEVLGKDDLLTRCIADAMAEIQKKSGV